MIQLEEILNLMNDEFTQQNQEILVRMVDDYLYQLRRTLLQQPAEMTRDILLSEYNYLHRAGLKSSRTYGLNITDGDIVYADFGRAYLSEMGFQHFALVLRVFNGKALVIPMTSNMETYHHAYDELINPEGLRHLFKIGKQKGCYKYSVLYLNDAKFINTARIINIKGHIQTDSILYKKIVNRLVEIIQLGQ